MGVPTRLRPRLRFPLRVHRIPLAIIYSRNCYPGGTIERFRRPKVSVISRELPFPLSESEVD